MKRMMLISTIVLLFTLAGCSLNPAELGASDGIEIESNLDSNEEYIDYIPLEMDIAETTSLSEALERRVATRRFIDKEIDFEIVSKILWAGHGVTYLEGEETVNGYDSLSSNTETPRYTVNPANHERGLGIYYISKTGAYEYVPEVEGLRLITAENLLEVGSNSARNTQFRVLITVNKDLYTSDIKWPYLVVGQSIQNMNLMATTENVQVFTQGMFDSESLKDVMEISDTEELAVLLSFGYTE